MIFFFFFFFPENIGFDSSCKLSSETICMKCHIKPFFLENKNKKNISKCECHLLKFLPRVLSI